jgi:hypothetical protein
VTRFDVTTSQTTKAFHHYTVGGELEVEDATVVSRHVDEVVCRWCGHGRSIVELGDDELALQDAGESGANGGTGDGAGREHEEPGAQSRIS